MQYTTPDGLVGLLFLAGVLLTGSVKALLTAWEVRYTRPEFRSPITQRIRYRMILMGLACSIVAIGLPLHQYGFHRLLVALQETRNADPVLGWCFTIAVIIHCLVPVLAVLTASHVYRYPALFAKRANHYVTTRGHRAGVDEVARW